MVKLREIICKPVDVEKIMQRVEKQESPRKTIDTMSGKKDRRMFFTFSIRSQQIFDCDGLIATCQRLLKMLTPTRIEKSAQCFFISK